MDINVDEDSDDYFGSKKYLRKRKGKKNWK